MAYVARSWRVAALLRATSITRSARGDTRYRLGPPAAHSLWTTWKVGDYDTKGRRATVVCTALARGKHTFCAHTVLETLLAPLAMHLGSGKVGSGEFGAHRPTENPGNGTQELVGIGYQEKNRRPGPYEPRTGIVALFESVKSKPC